MRRFMPHANPLMFCTYDAGLLRFTLEKEEGLDLSSPCSSLLKILSVYWRYSNRTFSKINFEWVLTWPVHRNLNKRHNEFFHVGYNWTGIPHGRSFMIRQKKSPMPTQGTALYLFSSIAIVPPTSMPQFPIIISLLLHHFFADGNLYAAGINTECEMGQGSSSPAQVIAFRWPLSWMLVVLW